MNTDAFIDILRQMLWVAVLLSMPVLAVALVVGFAIGLMQAMTSIQEQTLSFIPKLIAMVVVLVLLGPWMTRILGDYTAGILAGLPAYGRL